jgi:hypothetical protein
MQILTRQALQEEALALSKKVHGDKSAQSTRDVQLLAHLHLRLGNAEIKEGDYGSWVIDDAESWHWDMVTKFFVLYWNKSANTDAAHPRLGD